MRQAALVMGVFALVFGLSNPLYAQWCKKPSGSGGVAKPGGGPGGAQEPPPTISWDSPSFKKLKKLAEETASKSDATTKVRKKAKQKKAVADKMALTVLDDARESGKPILLFFSAPDKNTALGQKCLSFENFVLRNQKIFDAAQKFHRVKIDPTKVDRAILKKYRIKVAPTVLFLSYDGKVITQVKGKSKPDYFLKALNAALAKNAKMAKKAGKTAS